MPSRRDFLLGVGGVAGSVPLANTTTASAAATTAPTRTWTRTYAPATAVTNEGRALVRDIVPMTNGVALVGLAGGSDHYHGWIGRVDAAGRSRWHHLDETGQSTLLAGTPSRDDADGIVAAGGTNLTASHLAPRHADPYALRVGADGDVSWTHTYQPSAADGRATAIANVTDGYVVAGNETVGNDERLWAAHLDSHGTRSWTWHSERAGSVNAITSVPGGVIIAGSTGPLGADSPAPRGRQEAGWIGKLTKSGSLTWQWHVDHNAGDRIEDLAPAPNGGVVAVGRRGFSVDDRGVGWLVALDSDGQKRWEQTYPQDGWNWHHGIASVDTGYVLVGTRAEEPDTDADARGAWLLRVDAEGQVVWEHQAEPGTGGFAVQPLGDGGLLVGGAASTDGHAGEVAWLAKVGGDPTSGTTAEDVLSLPTLPDWTTPLVAGTVIGALGARAVASWRQS